MSLGSIWNSFLRTKFFRFNWSLFSFHLFRFLPLCFSMILRDHTISNFLYIFAGFFTHLLFPPFSYLRFCVDILFRTFLDLFYLSPLTSFTWCFLSKILRGHTVPHFLRFFYPLSSYLLGFLHFSSILSSYLIGDSVSFSWCFLSKILRGHTVPHFLRFLFILSSSLFWFFWFISLHFSSPPVFGHRSYHEFPFLFCLRFWSQTLS